MRGDVVLSEVHLGLREDCRASVFEYAEPGCGVDEDGDLDPPRLRRLCLEHTLATPLEDVGTQIWRGSLLLCDWLLTRHLEGKRCLEVGSGAGLAGILAASRGAAATLTDGSSRALELAQRNATRNGVHVHTKHLDWFEPWETFPEFDLVLAADVVYDDRATEALVANVLARVVRGSCEAVVALELRFNFDAASLSVAAHGYRRFLELVSSETGLFAASKLDHLPAQRLLGYERGDGCFEMWLLRAAPPFTR